MAEASRYATYTMYPLLLGLLGDDLRGGAVVAEKLRSLIPAG
jgi:hypothetical protein